MQKWDLTKTGRRGMSKKITWLKIYNDFRKRHPNMRKEVIHWCPKDYLTIELWLKDGSRLNYYYWDHKATFIVKGESYK